MKSHLSRCALALPLLLLSGLGCSSTTERDRDSTDTRDPETQDPETQDPETQDPETQDPETQEPETQDPDTQDPETQDPETQDPDTQDPDTQDPETQDPETQDPETQDPETQDPGTTLAGELDPGGRHWIVILDDPERPQVRAGLELIASWCRPQDGLGIVSPSGLVWLPLASVGSGVDRLRFTLLDPGARGVTVAAFERAAAMLDAGGGAESSYVVVLQGRAPVADNRELEAAAGRLTERGWKVAAIDLDPVTPEDSEWASAVGGDRAVVRDRVGLTRALATFAQDHFGMWVFVDPPEPWVILPGTREVQALACTAGASELGGLETTEGTVPSSISIHNGEQAGGWSWMAPSAGTYSLVRRDVAFPVLALVRAQVQATLTQPQASATVGSLPVVVKPSTSDGWSAVADALTVDATLFPSEGDTPLAQATLAWDPALGAFAGALDLGEDLAAQEVRVVARLTHPWGEPAQWSWERRVQVQALETQDPEAQDPETQDPETQDPETQDPETQDPETQDPETQDPETQDPETQNPATLTVAPPSETPAGRFGWLELPLEVAWPADAAAGHATWEAGPVVSEDGEIALSPPWDVELVSVDDWSGELSPGESHAMTYRVFLTADLPPGTYRGSVTLRSDVEGASTETPVELTFEVER